MVLLILFRKLIHVIYCYYTGHLENLFILFRRLIYIFIAFVYAA